MADDREDASNRDAELERRRARLDAELKKRQPDAAENGSGRTRSESAAGFANALRLSSEFVAGVVVGAALGWFLDRFFGTSPWGLIVFLLLGFCAGVLNVLRSAGLVAQGRIDTKDTNG